MDEGRRKRWPGHWAFWLIAIAAIIVLAAEGHRIAHLLPRIERWIQALGPWGPLAYIVGIVALAPLFFPNTILGLTGGVVFGVWEGYFLYFVGVYLANLVMYFIGRRWLRSRILQLLTKREQIRRAVSAARSGGTALVFWIRMIPVNPAVFSYAFGAVQVRFRAIAIGMFGMTPHMFLDVYLGGAAAHVTKMAGEGHQDWEVKGIGLLIGLAALIGVTTQVVRIARKQVREAEEGLDVERSPAGEPVP